LQQRHGFYLIFCNKYPTDPGQLEKQRGRAVSIDRQSIEKQLGRLITNPYYKKHAAGIYFDITKSVVRRREFTIDQQNDSATASKNRGRGHGND